MPQAPPPPPEGAPPPAAPPPESSGGTDNRTIMLVLSYLGILSLIPLLTEKEDKEVQWHAKNGLCIFAAYAICGIGLSILRLPMPWGMQSIFSMLLLLLFLGYLIIIVLGIMKAVNNERLFVPIISDFVDKF